MQQNAPAGDYRYSYRYQTQFCVHSPQKGKLQRELRMETLHGGRRRKSHASWAATQPRARLGTPSRLDHSWTSCNWRSSRELTCTAGWLGVHRRTSPCSYTEIGLTASDGNAINQCLPFSRLLLVRTRQAAGMHAAVHRSPGENEDVGLVGIQAHLPLPDSRFYIGQRKNGKVIEARDVHVTVTRLQAKHMMYVCINGMGRAGTA